jgi:predicted amidohydrolase
MKRFIVETHLFDVGADYQTVEGCIDNILNKTVTSWSEGTDIVLFPEYAWLNLAQYREEFFDLEEFAEFFWASAWPKIKTAFEKFDDKMVVLGTVPYLTENGIANRAIIYADGEFIFQDKLCTTPWESQVSPGHNLYVIDYSGIKCAIFICLDIEIPILAEKLKHRGDIDMILVPSATENLLGVERIARCASARAVELSTAVVTCALLGAQLDNAFIDRNIGRAALYLPSLQEFSVEERMIETELFESGEHKVRFEIDTALLRQARSSQGQTNPALLFSLPDIEIV